MNPEHAPGWTDEDLAEEARGQDTARRIEQRELHRWLRGRMLAVLHDLAPSPVASSLAKTRLLEEFYVLLREGARLSYLLDEKFWRGQ